MTKRTRLALLLCFIAFTACSYGAFRIGVVVFAKYGLFKELVAAACKEMAGCVRADVFTAKDSQGSPYIGVKVLTPRSKRGDARKTLNVDPIKASIASSAATGHFLLRGYREAAVVEVGHVE